MEHQSTGEHSLVRIQVEENWRLQAFPFAYYNTLLSDLDAFGWNNIQSITESLQQIILSVEDPSHRLHDVQVTLPPTYPEGAPQCQLSLPANYTFTWKRTNTLNDIYLAVKDVLAKYDEVWTVLEDFDSHCVVLDPAKPTFEHNYRRIFLERQCSLYYTVNIDKPRSIGDWKFFGPPSETDHYDQLTSKNMHAW